MAESKNIDFSCIIKPVETLQDIVYKDNYQVILKNY